jgi:hypothetical protein
MLTLKLALRTLLRTPVVTMVAVLSLALGIGANAAIFSLFNQMLLRMLPVQEPQRLVNFRSPGPKAGSTNCGQAGDCDAVFSYGMFRDLQKAQTVFTDIAAHVPFDANVAAGGQTSNEDGLLVSGSYFPVLGVQPALGRLLTTDDEPAIGESHVAVLSHALWPTRFGLDPNVLNQSIVVNGQSLTIVGVAARGLNGTTPILWQVGAMTLVGGTIGLAAAISIGWLAQSLLFELKGWDPGVLGVSVVVLSIVALGAGFIPAHRASRVEPMRALRYE